MEITTEIQQQLDKFQDLFVPDVVEEDSSVYALVFWYRSNYTFNVIDAVPIPDELKQHSQHSVYGDIPVRIKDGEIIKLHGYIHAVGGKCHCLCMSTILKRLMIYGSQGNKDDLNAIGLLEKKKLEEESKEFFRKRSSIMCLNNQTETK